MNKIKRIVITGFSFFAFMIISSIPALAGTCEELGDNCNKYCDEAWPVTEHIVSTLIHGICATICYLVELGCMIIEQLN